MLLAGLAERLPQFVLTTEVRRAPDIVRGITSGSIDIGLVRCTPKDAQLTLSAIRLDRQGVLLHREHPLASRQVVEAGELADQTLLMHPREANPGQYDAVLELCAQHGFQPLDMAQTKARVAVPRNGGVPQPCAYPRMRGSTSKS